VVVVAILVAERHVSCTVLLAAAAASFYRFRVSVSPPLSIKPSASSRVVAVSSEGDLVLGHWRLRS